MSEIEKLSKQLQKFMPLESCDAIANVIIDENVKLTITKNRKTKLGDYRAPNRLKAYHRISVNGDLNPYMFLLVLLHEFAHMHVWIKNKFRVKAHGHEWKHEYRKMYQDFAEYFPENVQQIIQTHFKNLKATTCNDPYLTKHLMHMDKSDVIQILHDLEAGDHFEIKGRQFEVLNKRRTRFLCKDLENKRNYLVSGSAVVTQLNK